MTVDGSSLSSTLFNMTKSTSYPIESGTGMSSESSYSEDDDSFASNPDEEQQDGTISTYTMDKYEPNEKRGTTPAPTFKRRNVKLICVTAAIVIVVLAVTIIAVVFTVRQKKQKSDNLGRMSPRKREIEEFLDANQISTRDELRLVDSPANLALTFISDEDEMQMQLTEESVKRFVERYVLVFLYYQFEGSGWKHNLNFLSGGNHCEWYHDVETSSGPKLRLGVACSTEGYVTELNLASNNLRGAEIPQLIKHLKEMIDLHMYHNEIGGYFPFAFREMTNLQSIGLMRTGLIGTVPMWIGEMTSLTSLGLGHNFLQGPIPSSLGNLTGLKILGLDSNDGISGNITVLKQLTNLEALYLENNYLSGDLSGANWPNLQELDVSGNYITGGLPGGLFGHPTLRVLDVNNNQISGEFPTVPAFNEKLEYLAIHYNDITGSLPEQLGFLMNLKHLDVSFNSLSGAMPESLTQLTNLYYLATSSNSFATQNILDLRGLTNLQDLSLKDNNLNGTIPTWFSALTNLKLLDLDANQFTGTIPVEIGELIGLEYLLLNRNFLNGTLPDLTALSQLDILLLDGNDLSGTADTICNSNSIQLTHFIADCDPGRNGEAVEFECACCTQCCRAGREGATWCNDQAWTANVDVDWEVGYQRQEYDFDLENAPSAYSKASSP